MNHRRAVVVGRDPELTSLAELAGRTIDVGAQVVFVSGEAGIGKSTLVSHFLDELEQERWTVHVGQCIEYSERAIPFGAVISLMRSVLAAAGTEAEDVLGHHRPDLAALLPEWRSDGLDGASLTGDVDRLIDAVATVLMRAAHGTPMALFVEDIHWADGPTRDVVASLIHALGTTQILLIVSERTGAVPRGHQIRTWLAEQRRFPNVHTMALSGLSTEALTQQAENILGAAPDESLITELAQRTGGNAYFSSELLLAKREGAFGLPTTLTDFLTSRLEQLDGEDQNILQAMAIAGEPISHRLLTAAVPGADLNSALRRLFDSSLISIDNGDYDFGHALMREAVLRRMLPFEVEDLHRRIAEAMEADPARRRSPADLATLAVHWAGANDAPQSLRASVIAAKASADVGAFEPAAELAIDALEAWEIVPDAESLANITRDDLTADASDWLLAADRVEQAGDLLFDAKNSRWAAELPTGRRALILAKLSPIRFLGGRVDEASSLMEEAAALVGDEISPQAARIHNRVSRLALLNAAIHPAIEAADRAIEIATAVGPERVLVEAMTTKALGVGVTVGKEEGVELVLASRRRALASNLVSQVAQTYRTEMMITCFRDGRTQASIDALAEGVEYANKHCGPGLRLDMLHDLALGLVEDGNLIEADPLIEILFSTPTKSLRYLAVSQAKALSCLLAGDLEEAETVLIAARQLANFFSSQELGFQNRLEAEVARRQGDFDKALRLVDTALELQLASDNLTFTRETIIEKCRLVRAINVVDPERAAELRPITEQLVDALGSDSLASSALVELMRLLLDADGDVSAADAAALVVRLGQSGCGADAKQTAALHLELLAAEAPGSPEVAEAAAALRSLGESSGMTWLSEVANEIAGPADESIDLTVVDITDASPAPAAVTPADDHGLTPREIEVLGFLARGLTNKEIGAELYVSHRTVSTHVSNLLAKLHLKNRSEAASKFHELGFARATP